MCNFPLSVSCYVVFWLQLCTYMFPPTLWSYTFRRKNLSHPFLCSHFGWQYLAASELMVCDYVMAVTGRSAALWWSFPLDTFLSLLSLFLNHCRKCQVLLFNNNILMLDKVYFVACESIHAFHNLFLFIRFIRKDDKQVYQVIAGRFTLVLFLSG